MVLIFINYQREYCYDGGDFSAGTRAKDNVLDRISLSTFSKYASAFISLICQIWFMVSVLKKKSKEKNSLIVLLIGFSFAIIFQTLILFLHIPLLLTLKSSHYGTFGFNVNTWLHISLYIDFVSYFFYISLVFGMIVNQKSRAIRRSNSAAACILSLCLTFALAVSMISIEMSEIVRSFSKVFVHTGKVKFYEQMISRMCYIFPVASVIIYLIYYRKKRKLAEQSALTMYPVYKSSQDNIIFNIMITSVIYGVLLIVHDVTSIFPSDESRCFGAEYTPTVQLFNFVPELFLPISFMISTRKSWKKVGIEGSILVIRISTIAVH
ncbi:hypothetical protein CRE_08894 [Caenorhabditis remanei]|uniref:Uncharacterized protein n=1 Tax=Caenorhabditis remanei TaxID=31234 RepID=E3LI56_CAERE|nr:hypothetical protein CRE_08894 [Caenorhabditis remanei]